MKIMGLSESVYWCGWCVTAAVQMFGMVIALTLILHLGRILPHSNPWIVLLFLQMFALSSVAFSYVVTFLKTFSVQTLDVDLTVISKAIQKFLLKKSFIPKSAFNIVSTRFYKLYMVFQRLFQYEWRCNGYKMTFHSLKLEVLVGTYLDENACVWYTCNSIVLLVIFKHHFIPFYVFVLYISDLRWLVIQYKVLWNKWKKVL